MQIPQHNHINPSTIVQAIANNVRFFLNFFYFLNSTEFHRDLEIMLFGEYILDYDEMADAEANEVGPLTPEPDAVLSIR